MIPSNTKAGYYCLAAFGFSVFLAAIVEFISLDWGQDLNHMMYFGQRLTMGELHWTFEFDDKLPINQFIFFFPALANSFLLWRVIVVIFVLGASLAIKEIVFVVSSGIQGLRAEQQQFAGNIAAISSLAGYVFTHGYLHQVNPVAASCSAIALWALLRSSNGKRASSKVTFLVLGAFAASLSIGIRPYFLLILVLAPLWISIRNSFSFRKNAVLTALWFMMIATFGFAVNFLPYIYMGKTEIFWAGIMMLSQSLTPVSMTEIVADLISAVLENPIILFASVLSLAVGIKSVKGLLINTGTNPVWKYHVDVIALSLAAIVLILAMVLSKHFWPHYIQMFVPFLAIGSAFAYIEFSVLAARKHRNLWRYMIYACSVLIVILSFAFSVFRWVKETPSEYYKEPYVRQVAAYLNETSSLDKSFLHIDMMYTHFVLQEARNGFPHGANSVHIIKNRWWKAVSTPEVLNIPVTADEYCLYLEKWGPQIIFLSEEMDITECLVFDAGYELVKGPDGVSRHPLYIFERSRSRG